MLSCWVVCRVVYMLLLCFAQLLMNRENETVTERLERLKMEVAELADDVKAIKASC